MVYLSCFRFESVLGSPSHTTRFPSEGGHPCQIADLRFSIMTMTNINRTIYFDSVRRPKASGVG